MKKSKATTKENSYAAIFKNAEPIDPEQFAFAMQLASAGASYRMPMESPANKRFVIEMTDATVQHFGLTDNSTNRAAGAIVEHFAPDMEMARSALMRWMALMRIAQKKEMRKWERKPPDADYIEIYNAVFEAAAILPLNGNGDFRTAEFFHKVEEIAAREDAEEAAQKARVEKPATQKS